MTTTNRLDAAPQGAAIGHNHPPGQTRPCRECGAPFAPRRAQDDFCSRPCRQAFNNRRAMRGAQMYDLYMTLRYARPYADRFAQQEGLTLWTILGRLAGDWHEEDVRQRDGRASWQSIEAKRQRGEFVRFKAIATDIAPRRRR